MEISKTLTDNKLLVAIIAMVTLGVFWRLMPHVPNFAPIGAIALTAGTLLSKKQSALLLFAIMLITDSAIGFYAGFEWTWLALAFVIPLGSAIKRLPFAAKTSLGAISASLVFFVISNFGVWLTSGMYQLSFSGLVKTYVMALPFFGNTLISDFVFSSALFGLAIYLQSTKQAYQIEHPYLLRYE